MALFNLLNITFMEVKYYLDHPNEFSKLTAYDRHLTFLRLLSNDQTGLPDWAKNLSHKYDKEGLIINGDILLYELGTQIVCH